MISALRFVWDAVIPLLLMTVGAYYLLHSFYSHRKVVPEPWRMYVKPFAEHFVTQEYSGGYSKKSDAGVEVGISNGKTKLKVGEVLLADEEFEDALAKVQKAAETRLHIIELETTQ